jgi:hypothetical protein
MARSPLRIIKGVRRELIARSYDSVARFFPHDDSRLAQDAQEVWDHEIDSSAGSKEGSHWLGHGDWDDETWLGYGKLHLGMMEDAMKLAGRHMPIKTAMEWGSGGGANSSAFSAVVEKYFGVDISSSNLEECVRQNSADGRGNFIPIHVPAESPEAVDQLVRETGVQSIDFFLSTAVYQHLPGRKYAARVTKTAMNLLADDGLAIINIRYWDLPRQNRNWRRSYQDNAHEFNKYTVYEFEREMATAGLEILEVRMRPLTHHAYFVLRKKRTA